MFPTQAASPDRPIRHRRLSRRRLHPRIAVVGDHFWTENGQRRRPPIVRFRREADMADQAVDVAFGWKAPKGVSGRIPPRRGMARPSPLCAARTRTRGPSLMCLRRLPDGPL